MNLDAGILRFGGQSAFLAPLLEQRKSRRVTFAAIMVEPSANPLSLDVLK